MTSKATTLRAGHGDGAFVRRALLSCLSGYGLERLSEARQVENEPAAAALALARTLVQGGSLDELREAFDSELWSDMTWGRKLRTARWDTRHRSIVLSYDGGRVSAESSAWLVVSEARARDATNDEEAAFAREALHAALELGKTGWALSKELMAHEAIGAASAARPPTITPMARAALARQCDAFATAIEQAGWAQRRAQEGQTNQALGPRLREQARLLIFQAAARLERAPTDALLGPGALVLRATVGGLAEEAQRFCLTAWHERGIGRLGEEIGRARQRAEAAQAVLLAALDAEPQ